MTSTRRRFLQASLSTSFAGVAVSSGSASVTQSQDYAPSPEDSAETLEQMDGEGTEASPYVITDLEELQAMEADLEAYYELGADIDAYQTRSWNGENGFRPIGGHLVSEDGSTEQKTAEITFDGNGYVIYGLTIDRRDRINIGLFGRLDGFIRNLTLKDVEIRASREESDNRGKFIGGIAGTCFATVKNCEVTGHVSGQVSVGGIAGTAQSNSQITNCVANVDVKASGGGSLVGFLSGNDDNDYGLPTVVGCQASGTIEALQHSDIDGQVGGLVGFSDGIIKDSVSTATVDGRGARFVGGLVGMSYRDVVGCAAKTTVRGGDYAGGLIGLPNSDSVTKYSYCDSEIIAQDKYEHCGGLFGGFGGVAKNCFATTTIRQSDSGEDVGSISGQIGFPIFGAGGMTFENTYAAVQLGDDTADERAASLPLIGENVESRDDVTLLQSGTELLMREASEEWTLSESDLQGENAKDSLAGFDFEERWETGEDHPRFRWETPTYEITSMDISASEIGVPLTVDLEVANRGTQRGTADISVSGGELGSTSQEVTVEAGGVVTTSLDLPTSGVESGFYSLRTAVGESVRTEEVELVKPTAFELQWGSVNQPTAGETVDVSLTVQNTGDSLGIRELTLTVEDVGSVKKELYLESGEIAQTTVSLSTAEGDAGTHELVVESQRDSLTETVTIQEDDSADTLSDDSSEDNDTNTPTPTPTATPTATPTQTATSTDGDGAGFGVGTALASVSGALYVLKGRFSSNDSEDDLNR